MCLSRYAIKKDSRRNKAFYKMLIQPPYCFVTADKPDAAMTLTISVCMCVAVWFFRSVVLLADQLW